MATRIAAAENGDGRCSPLASRSPLPRCSACLVAAPPPAPGRPRPGSPTRPGEIVPIPASIPHEEGDMVDSASSPTCAGSPPASRSTSPTATPGRCPAANTSAATAATSADSDHYNGLAVDIVPLNGRAANATPPGPAITRLAALGRAGAEPTRSRPSAGSATTATPATAAATTSTSPGTTRRRRCSSSPNGSKSSRSAAASRRPQRRARTAPQPQPPKPPARASAAASRRSTPAASPPAATDPRLSVPVPRRRSDRVDRRRAP